MSALTSVRDHARLLSSHRVQRSSFSLSLFLSFSAFKPIQARLRLRACRQHSSVCPQNSGIYAFILHLRLRLLSSSVLATSSAPNPIAVFATLSTLYVGRPSQAWLVLARVTTCGFAQSPRLHPAPYGRAVHSPGTSLVLSFAYSLSHAVVAPVAPRRFTPRRYSRASPTCGSSRWLALWRSPLFTLFPSLDDPRVPLGSTDDFLG